MNKHPVKRAKRGVRTIDRGAVEVLDPEPKADPFVSFRYSYTSIGTAGGKAYLKSRKARFEDGKLTSEAFDGSLDRGVYDQIVSQAQQYFLGQMALFLQSLSLFLPSPNKQPPRDE